MNRQGILDSSEPECSHEGYIAEKHVYCPDCGDAGAEMLLQERIAELEADVLSLSRYSKRLEQHLDTTVDVLEPTELEKTLRRSLSK